MRCAHAILQYQYVMSGADGGVATVFLYRYTSSAHHSLHAHVEDIVYTCERERETLHLFQPPRAD